jgi:hypothetical protein
MYEDSEIVMEGVFLYDGTVPCDIRIYKHPWRYGTGDPYDEPEQRDDVEGEFYYIEFGSTVERGKFVSGSMAIASLDAAIREAEEATAGKITWLH